LAFKLFLFKHHKGKSTKEMFMMISQTLSIKSVMTAVPKKMSERRRKCGNKSEMKNQFNVLIQWHANGVVNVFNKVIICRTSPTSSR
jgi:hypothetical protein